MGKRTLWLDTLPEREVVSRDGCSYFRVDERGRSFFFLVVAAFGTLAALAAPVLLSEREAPILVGAGALLTAFALCQSLRSVWVRKVLAVDPVRGELSLLKRSPWKARREVLPMASLRSVCVELLPDSDLPPGQWRGIVLLDVDEGDSIALGCDSRRRAAALARRLAELTGVPYREDR
jgi:hypothetical protein